MVLVWCIIKGKYKEELLKRENWTNKMVYVLTTVNQNFQTKNNNTIFCVKRFKYEIIGNRSCIKGETDM